MSTKGNKYIEAVKANKAYLICPCGTGILKDGRPLCEKCRRELRRLREEV